MVSIGLIVLVFILAGLNPSETKDCLFVEEYVNNQYTEIKYVCGAQFGNIYIVPDTITYDNCQNLNGLPTFKQNVKVLDLGFRYWIQQDLSLNGVGLFDNWRGVCSDVADTQIQSVNLLIIVLVIIAAIAILAVIKMI